MPLGTGTKQDSRPGGPRRPVALNGLENTMPTFQDGSLGREPRPGVAPSGRRARRAPVAPGPVPGCGPAEASPGPIGRPKPRVPRRGVPAPARSRHRSL